MAAFDPIADIPRNCQNPAMAEKPREAFQMGGKISYWVSGLPVALRNASVRHPDALGELRRAYAALYWSSDPTVRQMRWKAILMFVPVLLQDIKTFTSRNGRRTKQRYGRSIIGQCTDQLRVYFKHGILPRWYYIFSLYEPGGLARARYFLNRFETKPALFLLLNRGAASQLDDKVAFAAHCVAHGIAHVPILAAASDGRVDGDSSALPRDDLFIKPIQARGGAGAERWTWVADEDGYRGPGGETLSGDDLLARLKKESVETPRLVQPRATNHPDIADLSNGALTTLRVLSCLDEQRRPEIIGAVFRMAVGKNHTVDNFHAGGIAASVDLATGVLGRASNLGHKVKKGWLSRHPDTGGQIEGRTLPLWEQVKTLVEQAHLAFDQIVIGWDIAILAEGASLVEGNSGPDVDIMQRLIKRGLGQGRFVDHLVYHLRNRQQDGLAGGPQS